MNFKIVVDRIGTPCHMISETFGQRLNELRKRKNIKNSTDDCHIDGVGTGRHNFFGNGKSTMYIETY